MEDNTIEPTLQIRNEEEKLLITYLIQLLVVLEDEPFSDFDFFKKQLEYIEKGYETGPYNKNRICKAYEMYVRQESPVDRLKEFMKDWKERKGKKIKEKQPEIIPSEDDVFAPFSP
jgi:hypothetical protein